MRLTSISACALLAAGSAIAPANAQTQPVTLTFSYNGPALPIYRDSADVITVANIVVPRALRVTKVTANVEIDYPRPGDLNVFMFSPILTRTKLLERNCSGQGSIANVTFDDAAPTRFSDTCPATAGSYRGNEPLSNFNGQVAFGLWSLAVENNGSNDFIGYLRGFTVTITGTVVTNQPITASSAVYNAASLSSGAIAPGELIHVQGFNLGPSPAVAAPSGNLPQTLGGVQVTFDGTPAAIAYVSPYVLTVQAPFNLQAGRQSEMRIVFQGSTSESVLLDVLNAAPGVYTVAADGKGLVKAVNPDGSMNSSSRPAPKGQTVVVYAAGLGALSPALNVGAAPPGSPLSTATWPVTAVIDGLTANVFFAGAAPSYPGVYQINVQIPMSSASGARPLTVFAAGVPSQSDLVVYVQ